jgi:restriction system protein
VAIPDFQTLMLPVLQKAVQGEVRISDVVDQIADDLGISVEERGQLLPSGRQTTFANRVNWAKSYLGKAGLIELTRRAHFKITDRGRDVLAQNPPKIDIRLLDRFPEFKAFREAQRGSANDDDESASTPETISSLTPDEVMRSAARQLDEALAEELLARIRASTPAFFESLVVRLLFAMGYGGSVGDLDRALVGRSGDGGVDGVIDQDALGLDRIYVQAKRYKEGNTVGAPDIRDFFGSLDRFKASKGLFVTASSFTSAARETAELLSKRIVLIEGLQLARLMIRFEVGCRIEETVTIKKVDEDFFE